jgi:hypothetical protein
MDHELLATSVTCAVGRRNAKPKRAAPATHDGHTIHDGEPKDGKLAVTVCLLFLWARTSCPK